MERLRIRQGFGSSIKKSLFSLVSVQQVFDPDERFGSDEEVVSKFGVPSLKDEQQNYSLFVKDIARACQTEIGLSWNIFVSKLNVIGI